MKLWFWFGFLVLVFGSVRFCLIWFSLAGLGLARLGVFLDVFGLGCLGRLCVSHSFYRIMMHQIHDLYSLCCLHVASR